MILVSAKIDTGRVWILEGAKILVVKSTDI